MIRRALLGSGLAAGLAGACACASAPLIAAACSQPARVEQTWDAYDGAAYPDTRAKVVLPSGDFALVPSSGSDTLTAIDLGAGRVVGAAPVGRSPVVLDGPHQVVADLGRRVAYVVLSYPDALESAGNHSHGASKRPGWVQAVALDDLRAIGEVRVDPNPGEIALSEDSKRLVVTHFDLSAAAEVDASADARRATISVVDPAAMQAFGTPEPDKLLACAAPHGLALSRPDGRTAFVACYGEAALAVVDLADLHAPVVRVPVGANPYGVSLSPDGTRVALGTRESKDLRFFDLAKGAMEPLVVPALGETYVATWSRDGASLYMPTRALDALALIDAKTGSVTRQRAFDVATCAAPLEALLGSDASVVYLVCEGTAATPGVVLTLDATTLETRASTPAGFFPGRTFLGRGP